MKPLPSPPSAFPTAKRSASRAATDSQPSPRTPGLKPVASHFAGVLQMARPN